VLRFFPGSGDLGCLANDWVQSILVLWRDKNHSYRSLSAPWRQ
jgi:hypothetical protein